eukprot:scaffold53556_cov32-Tisochrysis_lutea.AAC.2
MRLRCQPVLAKGQNTLERASTKGNKRRARLPVFFMISLAIIPSRLVAIDDSRESSKCESSTCAAQAQLGGWRSVGFWLAGPTPAGLTAIRFNQCSIQSRVLLWPHVPPSS